MGHTVALQTGRMEASVHKNSDHCNSIFLRGYNDSSHLFRVKLTF